MGDRKVAHLFLGVRLRSRRGRRVHPAIRTRVGGGVSLWPGIAFVSGNDGQMRCWSPARRHGFRHCDGPRPTPDARHVSWELGLLRFGGRRESAQGFRGGTGEQCSTVCRGLNANRDDRTWLSGFLSAVCRRLVRPRRLYRRRARVRDKVSSRGEGPLRRGGTVPRMHFVRIRQRGRTSRARSSGGCRHGVAARWIAGSDGPGKEGCRGYWCRGSETGRLHGRCPRLPEFRPAACGVLAPCARGGPYDSRRLRGRRVGRRAPSMRPG